MANGNQDSTAALRQQELALARRSFPDPSQLLWRLLAEGADLNCLSSEGIGQKEIRRAARQALSLNAGQFRRERRRALLNKRYPRANHKWCPQEETRLLELCDEGRTLREMARVLGRHPQAVKERLQRLKKVVACSWPS